MRVDVMSRLRGVDAFAHLWKRRTTLTLADGFPCDLMALPDLVRAKKTQRDKDWPMLRRLVEAHYFQNRVTANPAQVEFWFLELRTPELLLELGGPHRATCQRLVTERPLLRQVMAQDRSGLEKALVEEELLEREKDRLYWLPLRQELERLRHASRRGSRLSMDGTEDGAD